MHKIPLKQKTGERSMLSGDLSVKVESDELNMLNDDVEIEAMKGSGMSHMVDSPEARAESLYQRAALNLDEAVKSKVLKILVPQLKGVRKLYETKLKLVSAVGKGGAGLSEKDADALLQVYLDEKHGQMLADNPERAKKMDQPKKVEEKVKSPEVPANLPIVNDLSVDDGDVAVSDDIVEETIKPELLSEKKGSPVTNMSEVVEQEVDVVSASDVKKESPARSKEPDIPVVQKTPVDTVKQPEYTTSLIGPLEELHTMDLKDFRQLAGSPMAQAQKVQAKIDTIGESSVAEKLAAIKAWKESQVMNAYLVAGKDSVMSGDSIVDVINKQLLSDPGAITLDEFNAIMELNENLREID